MLGYWRVKRWEASILASQQSPASAAPTTAASEDDFAIRGMSRIEFLRSGLGLSPRRQEPENEESQRLAQAEEARPETSPTSPGRAQEEEPEVLDPNDPRYQEMERNRRFINALRNSSLI